MPKPDFLGSDWCALKWSRWIPFNAPRRGGFQDIPAQPGIYRVRVSGQPLLAYIGQTGRSLRERVMALSLHTLAAEMPWNDPHTAAPSLWSFRDAEGLEFEVSGAMIDSDRRGLECYLLWKYRLATSHSTMCNFGRLHKHYRKSRNRSTGNRGGLLSEGQINPNHASSYPPLQVQGTPASDKWMGLKWSTTSPLSGNLQSVSRGAGVYRFLDSDSGELLYIGEAQDLHSRLRSHERSGRTLSFSYCPLSELRAKNQRLEVENDLIGAFFSETRHSPRLQFGPSN